MYIFRVRKNPNEQTDDVTLQPSIPKKEVVVMAVQQNNIADPAVS